MLVLFRIDQDHAVLVEQLGIAFDNDLQVAFVLEADPGRTVGQRVGAHAGGGVERGAHARTGGAVPVAAGGLDVDAGALPKLQLSLVRTRIIAARGERRLGRGNRLQGCGSILRARHFGRVACRTDDDEVIVHDVEALDAATLGNKFFFGRFGVHQKDVAIAVRRILDGLAGADCHHANVDAGLLLEHRQDVIEQAGVLR